MPFERQPRYWLRHRASDLRWWYLNEKGEPTRAPKLFGEDWSNGLPAQLTYDQCIKLREQVGKTDPDTKYTLVLARGGYNY